MLLSGHVDHNVDAASLNLRGFYARLERVFLIVAARIDQSLPTGASRRRELPLQRAVELPDTRPAVIFGDLVDELDRYRGFRQVGPQRLRPRARRAAWVSRWFSILLEQPSFTRHSRGR